MTDERSWINALRPGDNVDEHYAVRSRELRQRRAGGAFLAVSLGDRSGQMAALVWEDVERIGRLLEPGRVVRIRGQVQRYNQRLQMIVRDAREVADDEIATDDFVRAARTGARELWERLTAVVEGLSDPHLRQLMFRTLADPEVADRLRTAPAARSMHHAYRSGLLEHTLSVCAVVSVLARHYELEHDLAVAGALLHDLGKLWELDLGSVISYSDDGQLLGHLAIETLYVDRLIAELPEFPSETRRQLLHILLAHHGEYAYGSPRRPKTPEALLVHMVDNLDSKMAGMLEAIADGAEGDEAWSGVSRILGRPVYRRRISEDGETTG